METPPAKFQATCYIRTVKGMPPVQIYSLPDRSATEILPFKKINSYKTINMAEDAPCV